MLTLGNTSLKIVLLLVQVLLGSCALIPTLSKLQNNDVLMDPSILPKTYDVIHSSPPVAARQLTPNDVRNILRLINTLILSPLSVLTAIHALQKPLYQLSPEYYSVLPLFAYAKGKDEENTKDLEDLVGDDENFDINEYFRANPLPYANNLIAPHFPRFPHAVVNNHIRRQLRSTDDGAFLLEDVIKVVGFLRQLARENISNELSVSEKQSNSVI
ncbi:uncharacterized protein LOC143225515 [Tachypleus tridentatus]|uniref:uncharacterized protein LOC143225515 n=1 Tax=Tachypleus tridentatus TaxID=6853 RepID=UPI003FCF7230